jgi:hypothetical protein
MSNEMDADFEKSDIILSEALEQFQGQGVNQYVWGMAMVEIGVLALVKLEEDDDSILESVRQFIQKSRAGIPGQSS